MFPLPSALPPNQQGSSINNSGLQLRELQDKTLFKKEFLGKPKDNRGGKKSRKLPEAETSGTFTYRKH